LILDFTLGLPSRLPAFRAVLTTEHRRQSDDDSNDGAIITGWLLSTVLVVPTFALWRWRTVPVSRIDIDIDTPFANDE